MIYPLISEYIEAIKSAEDNFNKLSNLRPVLDEEGQPVISNGNFAVVFKMKDLQTGKFYAVKCFTKEQEGRGEAYRLIAEELEFVSSTFLTSIKYYERELFVDTNTSDETEFPVLLMDWVEGVTLDKYIREHIDDEYELSLLAYQFSRLAMWLMPQSFAHGDLKPDNILVREDGTLVLVDYDGMYVPAMKGQKARELGSPDFRHPLRTENDFDEHIDDFSLASILFSLKAISLNPSLLEEYGASDRLLLSEKDYLNLAESKIINATKPLLQDKELATLLSLFILSTSQKDLSQISFLLFSLARPIKSNFSEEVTHNYLNKMINTLNWKQKRALFYYSMLICCDDYLRWNLDKMPKLLRDYQSLLGLTDTEAQHIASPNTYDLYQTLLSYNTNNVEYYPDILNYLKSIRNPIIIVHFIHTCLLLLKKYEKNHSQEVFSIIIDALGDYAKKSGIEISSNNDYFEQFLYSIRPSITEKDLANAWTDEYGIKYSADRKRLLKGNDKIRLYKVKEGTTTICDNAFSGCSALSSIEIPMSVYVIGENAFYNCSAIKSLIIPNNLARIGKRTFMNCSSLTNIIIPKATGIIEACAFTNCSSLKEITIPESILLIDDYAFSGCSSLSSIDILGAPKWGNRIFLNCKNLTSIYTPSWTNRDLEGMPHQYADLVDRTRDYPFINSWSLEDFIKIYNILHFEKYIDCETGASCISFIDSLGEKIDALGYYYWGGEDIGKLTGKENKFRIGLDTSGYYFLYDKTLAFWAPGMCT